MSPLHFCCTIYMQQKAVSNSQVHGPLKISLYERIDHSVLWCRIIAIDSILNSKRIKFLINVLFRIP